jgi:hypothetical protein
MQTKEIFEQCIRFVSKLENRESELDLASQMDIEVEEIALGLMVIQKLKLAIKLVEAKEVDNDHSRVLYYIALYANGIGKPRFGISLCYIVINEPATNDKYRYMAKHLLNEIKLKLPEEMYKDELHKTTLDIDVSLRDSHEWLTQQERHASQPPTKHIFNSDLIKKYMDKKARK